jgi:hypothetical protein
LLIPVVVPDFALLDVIFLVFILVSVAAGAAVPSLEAPGVDCVCADAIVVAPTSEAATITESASLDRMKILLFGYAVRDSEPATPICVPGHTAVSSHKKVACAVPTMSR